MLLKRPQNAPTKSNILLNDWQPSSQTYANSISNKITTIQYQYSRLIESAEAFYITYDDNCKALKKNQKLISAYKEQIKFLEDYKSKNGKLPKIKNQESSSRYLVRLHHLLDKTNHQQSDLQQNIRQQQMDNAERLERICEQVLSMLSGLHSFNQFIGSLILSSPSADSKNRCLRNEKSKPLLIGALSVLLFDHLRRNKQLKCRYLAPLAEQIFKHQDETIDYSLIAHKSAFSDSLRTAKCGQYMPDDIRNEYDQLILKPLLRAALVHSIGRYSPAAKALFGENSYQKLPNKQRAKLLDAIYNHSQFYISSFTQLNPDDKDNLQSYQLSQHILQRLQVTNDPMGDLLRLPMVFASVALSTKENYNYQQIHACNQIFLAGLKANQYRKDYTQNLQKILGRFPIGSGVYFIQEENGEIEKALVSSLLPFDEDEPIAKQVTRRQLQFIGSGELIICQESNLYFAETRKLSYLSPQVLELKFGNHFSWDATEVWDLQISSAQFWRTDGSLKINGRYVKYR
ncbi:hypothetical protein [Gayadomonas joobiniege]|uniref:hypothetical protein n=1 Tax=Gayadomonas joobiniege TaxID=1234606 RepID=UPI0003743EB9|nr:hypothetical protein [Gayadomonas joobiniege]